MEPFKNWVNKKTITVMAKVFSRLDVSFLAEDFIALASKNISTLELKARTLQVAHALHEFLPGNFKKAAKLIEKSLAAPLNDRISGSVHNEEGIGGWSTMILADYVAFYGQAHPQTALSVLQAITRRGSAEFAIRHFLMQQQYATLQILQHWIDHPDHHVRRLVSEGTRPRLPWGFQLPSFITDPTPLLPLLDALKDDKSEYVRRSVANNLNDIAKDHPDLVCRLARSWMNPNDRNSIRLFRHACRTLLKKDHPDALALFGYAQPEISRIKFKLSAEKIRIGDSIDLSLTLKGKPQQHMMIDYVVHHCKASGKTSPKVFKWSKQIVGIDGHLQIRKKHSFKPVTTRVYYSGVHDIEVKINGVVMIKQSFELMEAL